MAPLISAHFSGTPGVRACKSFVVMGCCALSPGLSQGSANSRVPINGPTRTHMPCAAQMRVFRPESRPKTYEGPGAQGAPSATLRATFGTQSAESQYADASPAKGIDAESNPQATTGAAMILRTSASFGDQTEPASQSSLALSSQLRASSQSTDRTMLRACHGYPAGVNLMLISVRPRRMNVGS
jgi:hypothetical protein